MKTHAQIVVTKTQRKHKKKRNTDLYSYRLRHDCNNKNEEEGKYWDKGTLLSFVCIVKGQMMPIFDETTS
jgi:hypothetical protein